MKGHRYASSQMHHLLLLLILSFDIWFYYIWCDKQSVTKPWLDLCYYSVRKEFGLTIWWTTWVIDLVNLDENIFFGPTNLGHLSDLLIQSIVSTMNCFILKVTWLYSIVNWALVLLPKKGANKYSQHVYSLSVTLQHSHL